MKVRDESGHELDATFHAEVMATGPAIVYESRGGSRSGPDARNVDYEKGLELLLARLQALNAVLRSVRLHPANRALGSELALAGFGSPLRLSDVPDVADLRRVISAAQAKTDRAPRAKGSGNPSKRIRI